MWGFWGKRRKSVVLQLSRQQALRLSTVLTAWGMVMASRWFPSIPVQQLLSLFSKTDLSHHFLKYSEPFGFVLVAWNGQVEVFTSQRNHKWGRAGRGDGWSFVGLSFPLRLIAARLALDLLSHDRPISSRFSLPVSGNCHPLPWSYLTWMRPFPLRRHGLPRLPISVSLAKCVSVFCEFYFIVNFWEMLWEKA